MLLCRFAAGAFSCARRRDKKKKKQKKRRRRGSPAFWPAFKVNNICSRFQILAEHELIARRRMSSKERERKAALLVTFSTQDEKPGKT